MTTFYTNKYPIRGAIEGKTKSDPFVDLPVGTVFTIHHIECDRLFLKPIGMVYAVCTNTLFSPEMLNFAFTASDELKE
jgi:hypothetical protein